MKYNKDSFISHAVEVHNNDYDYSKVDYVNKTTKVEIVCNKCGTIFWQTPKAHLMGQGCPKCGAEYARSWNKGNYTLFIDKAKKLYGEKYSFPNISNEYENNKSKITVKCNDCGYEFTKRPNDFLNPDVFKGCKNCREVESHDNNLITYAELLTFAKGNKVKPFDGKKPKRDGKVTAICPTHGEYETSIKSILNGKYNCRKCIGTVNCKKRIISEDEFKKRLSEKFGNTVCLIGEYTKTSTPALFKCNKCGYLFKRRPNGFLSGNLKDPCPKCSKELQSKEKTKTQEEFIKGIISVWGKDKFDLSETVYTKSSDKVKVKCNECGRTFEIEANCFLSGKHGCPYHNCNSSIKEKEISEYISSLGVVTLRNDRKLLNGEELDVFIPDYNIAIEFDGIFWHNELYKDKNYHIGKTKKCAKQGIRLLHIFEDEWIYKKDIWKSMISNLLGKTKNRVYARKCTIKEVSSSDASLFLENNHIQGKCGSSIRYGLYYNNELISLMTFGKTRHFIGSSKHEYELLRFCNKLNTNVIGGASKLFKHFVKEHDPNSVVSYADRRWSVGNLYAKLGFRLYNESNPNYFYIINGKRHNRFNFRKSILVEKYGCPQEMSERDFCKSQKWWRIYDCGSLCYEWVKKA